MPLPIPASPLLRNAGKKQKKILACARRRDVCCHQPVIPLYLHEVPGPGLYVLEKIEPRVQGAHRTSASRPPEGPSLPLPRKSLLRRPSCPPDCLPSIQCSRDTLCSPRAPYHNRRVSTGPYSELYRPCICSRCCILQMDVERDAKKVVRHIKGKIVNLQNYDWKDLVNDSAIRSARSW